MDDFWKRAVRKMIIYAKQGKAKYLGCLLLCLMYKTSLLVSPRSKQEKSYGQACSHWSCVKDPPKPHTLTCSWDVPSLFCSSELRWRLGEKWVKRSQRQKKAFMFPSVCPRVWTQGCNLNQSFSTMCEQERCFQQKQTWYSSVMTCFRAEFREVLGCSW